MIKTISAGIITKQAEKITEHLCEIARLRNTVYDQQEKLRDMVNECNEMARVHAKEIERLRNVNVTCEYCGFEYAKNVDVDKKCPMCERLECQDGEIDRLRKYRHRAKRSYRDLQEAYERMMAKHAAQGHLLSTRTSRLAEAYRRIDIKGNEISELQHSVDNLERSLAELVDKVTPAERAAFETGWRKAFGYYTHKQPGDMEACWEQYAEAKGANPDAE